MIDSSGPATSVAFSPRAVSENPNDSNGATQRKSDPDGFNRHHRRRVHRSSNLQTSNGAPTVAASYARYSSENQHESSINDQQRKCREWAEREGLTIDPEFEFADAAVSGTKLHRAGLDKLREAASRREFVILIFFSLSRLARESVISMPVLKELVYGVLEIDIHLIAAN